MLVMGRAGLLDRIGEENVCAHIDAARQELTSAMERDNDVLNTPAADFAGTSDRQ
jgi:hypothetical protein